MNGTPTDIANNSQSAMAWIGANSSAAEANACLIYAWNEVDEGGWIVPTLVNGQAGTVNQDVLNAIRQVILGH